MDSCFAAPQLSGNSDVVLGRSSLWASGKRCLRRGNCLHFYNDGLHKHTRRSTYFLGIALVFGLRFNYQTLGHDAFGRPADRRTDYVGPCGHRLYRRWLVVIRELDSRVGSPQFFSNGGETCCVIGRSGSPSSYFRASSLLVAERMTPKAPGILRAVMQELGETRSPIMGVRRATRSQASKPQGAAWARRWYTFLCKLTLPVNS